MPGGELGRHGGMRLVSIQADHPPPGRHSLSQQVENPARATAKIDRALSRPQSHPIQQRGGVSG